MLFRSYDYMYQLLVDANVKKEPENLRTVRTMLEELKTAWEDALVKLLREYQAAHPEDEDLKNALAELQGGVLHLFGCAHRDGGVVLCTISIMSRLKCQPIKLLVGISQ